LQRDRGATPGSNTMGIPTTLTAFGPGKVILLGEHAAVYGHPVLAAPLSWGVSARGSPSKKCELQIPPQVHGAGLKLLLAAFDRAAKACGRPKVSVAVQSDLPVSMGLGSSAALSVACARLLLMAAGRAASADQVVRVAGEMEREFHGRPSGVDHTCSALGKLILFRKRPAGSRPSVRAIESRRPLRIVVTLVGARSPTRHTVAALKERQARWPVRYQRLFREVGRVADEGASCVERGDLDALGDAMTVNHGLLSGLGLSSASIDQMVHRLRGMGALGAKLTGAGGDGGAVIGLFLEPEPAVARLTRDGVRCFTSQVAGPRAL
jgi:mevalonate kinase